jgi:hypothetical protein
MPPNIGAIGERRTEVPPPPAGVKRPAAAGVVAPTSSEGDEVPLDSGVEVVVMINSNGGKRSKRCHNKSTAAAMATVMAL